MIKTRSLIYAFSLMLLLCGVSSCEDDLADLDHYKSPSWLKGNAYEVLQSEGNYSIFLRGVDLSDYQSIVAGNSIVTVVAPDDEAFSEFLSEKGYSSIDDLASKDMDYLNKLIGYHLMYYAFDWDKMVNFRPEDGDGASDEEKAVYAGYYYKHRTHSVDPVEQLRVKLSSNASSDTLVYVYHYERYLPVFSNKMFETKGIDAKYNYNYFFPDTEWNGITSDTGGFNIANAKVEDTESVVTDNGYLYHVDRVIEPLNTINDELKNSSEYSKFYALYDSYSSYTAVSSDISTSLGYEAFIHTHEEVPNIAMEWPATSWEQTAELESEGYNVFAPTNDALDDLFETFWVKEGGYTSLDDLDPLITEYLIFQSFGGLSDNNLIVFPEEISNGDVVTTYGTSINIDPDNVTDRRMCCNGTLYGMDSMEPPAIFLSVVGPAFRDTTYLDFLYCLDNSSILLSLASNKSSFVTLMPSNTQFSQSDPPNRLYETTQGKQLQQYSSETGTYVEMSSSQMSDIVSIHYAQNISELEESGSQVVESNAAYNYWYIKNGKITTSALFDEQLEPTYTGSPFVAFHKLTDGDGGEWSNGSSYSYDAETIFSASTDDGLSHRLAICNDEDYPYYMFSQLLQKAGLVDGTELSSAVVFPDSRFIVFIPTNEVIENNLSSIPGCDRLSVSNGTLSGTLSSTQKTQLANYLRSLFISSTLNSFTTYPYLGSTFGGEYYTTGDETLNVVDTGSKLTVNFVGSESSADVIPDYDYFPFAFNDGGFHFIDAILQ